MKLKTIVAFLLVAAMLCGIPAVAYGEEGGVLPDGAAASAEPAQQEQETPPQADATAPPELPGVEETQASPPVEPPPSLEPSAENTPASDVPAAPEEALPDTLAEILEIAKTDGALAAAMLNEYTDTAMFEEGTRQVLQYYYTEEYYGLLDAFSGVIDARAAQILWDFATAKEERDKEGELGYAPGEVIVAYRENVMTAQAEAVVDELDGDVIEEIDTPAEGMVDLVEISPEQTVSRAIEEYEQDPRVEYAQPNFIYTVAEAAAAGLPGVQSTPNDPYINGAGGGTGQWNFDMLRMSGAWDIADGAGTGKVRVAVLDTGVAATHEDLGANLNRNLCVDATLPSLPRITTDGGNNGDGGSAEYHGTHVTGIIGATANNGIGVAGLAAGASNQAVEVMVVDVFKGESAYSSEISRGFNFALSNGAKVVNMSLGSAMAANDSLYGVDALLVNNISAAADRGTAVVLAAGNVSSSSRFGARAPFRNFPASEADCIAVISTDQSGGRSGGSDLTTGSNYYYRSASDAQAQNYVAAPGSAIVSTVPNAHGKYMYLNGTSMAAPAVASVIALMYYVNPNLSVRQIKTLLQQTSANAGAYQLQTGWGNVNGTAAVRAAVDAVLGKPVAAATQRDNISAAISWGSVPGAQYYDVYRSEAADGSYIRMERLYGTTSYVDLAVSLGRSYYYKVTAGASDSASASSDPTVVRMEMRAYPNTVEGFVQRMYELALSRYPDEGGRANWINHLKNGWLTGSEVVTGFFLSQEMQNKNLSNEEFIDLAYHAILNRNADAPGKANWLSYLNNGASRKFILQGFTQSIEFTNLCAMYGIIKGQYISDEPRDKNADVTAYVHRLYKLCLDREPDIEGINNWTNALLQHTVSGTQIAESFFLGPEFTGKRVSNSVYVDKLYRVMMNREGEAAGKQNWNFALSQGMSRRAIFLGFAGSPEFGQLCASYGIDRGVVPAY